MAAGAAVVPVNTQTNTLSNTEQWSDTGLASGNLQPFPVISDVSKNPFFTATNPGSVLAGSAQGTLTDRSGTVTAGGTAQTLAASNTSRKYLFIQNNSTGPLWVNFTTAAVTSQPSVQIAAGTYLVFNGNYITTELVSIIGATTGQAFTAKEG